MTFINGDHPRFKPLMAEKVRIEQEIAVISTQMAPPPLTIDHTKEEYQAVLDHSDKVLELYARYHAVLGEIMSLGWDNLDD